MSSFLGIDIDWDPTHGFLAQPFNVNLLGASGMVNLNPLTAIAANIKWSQDIDWNNIDWDPRKSETFREGVVPVVEAVGIAAATIYTGGAAGVALGAGAAAAARPVNTALGMQGTGFAAEYFPLIAALAGSAVNVVGLLGAAPTASASAGITAGTGATGGGAAVTGGNAVTSAIASAQAAGAALTPYAGAAAALYKVYGPQASVPSKPTPTASSAGQGPAAAGMTYHANVQQSSVGLIALLSVGGLMLAKKKKRK